MQLSKLIRVAMFAVTVAGSGTALAKGTATPQNHHCKLADGTMDMKKTKKQCVAAKGTWMLDAAKDAPKDPPKDPPKAPAPAPK